MARNRQWLLAARPLGRPIVAEDFKWVESDIPEPQAGQVLLRTLYLSFDPAQKGWVENRANYMAPTEIGQVMPARGIAEVLVSNHPGLQPGDKVSGWVGWQDYSIVAADSMLKLEDDEFLTANLGVLGSTGMTAFFGLNKIGKPFAGDTLVITGAAGATGSVVGQLGKLSGCRVVGIAGGPEKCRWLREELGFDAAIDYKAGDIREALKASAPDGIDVLWDNVGGALFNDLLSHLALHARVVVCGGIARYQASELPPGPENYFNLVFQRANMQGFIALDYVPEFPWARSRLKTWLREGRLRYREDIQSGLENAPETLMRLFSGKNIGKQLLKVA